jgi:hypothetical protein
LHNLAEANYLSHRKVINYREIYINQDIGKLRQGECYDGYVVTLSVLYVEFGMGYDKIIIGSESWIPQPQKFTVFDTGAIKQKKNEMKKQHKNMVSS